MAEAISRVRRQSDRGLVDVVGVDGGVEADFEVVEADFEGAVDGVVEGVEAVVGGLPPGRRVRADLRSRAQAGAVSPFRLACSLARRRRWRSATSARSRSVSRRPIVGGLGLFGEAPRRCPRRRIRVAGAGPEFFEDEFDVPGGAGVERMDLVHVRDPSRSVDQLFGWHADPPRPRRPQHSALGDPGHRRPAQSSRGRGSAPASRSIL